MFDFKVVTQWVDATLHQYLPASLVTTTEFVLVGVCFIGPYVIGLFWKKVSTPAVWASIISSLVMTFALIIVFGYDMAGWNCSFGNAIKNGIGCSPLIGVICMVMSVLITVIVSLFTKKPSKSILAVAFDGVKESKVV